MPPAARRVLQARKPAPGLPRDSTAPRRVSARQTRVSAPRDGYAKLAGRLDGSAIELTQQLLRLGVIRLETQGLPQLGHGVFPLVLDGKRGSQPVVGFCVIRLEGHPLAEAGNGLIDSPGIQVREPHDKVR